MNLSDIKVLQQVTNSKRLYIYIITLSTAQSPTVVGKKLFSFLFLKKGKVIFLPIQKYPEHDLIKMTFHDPHEEINSHKNRNG